MNNHTVVKDASMMYQLSKSFTELYHYIYSSQHYSVKITEKRQTKYYIKNTLDYNPILTIGYKDGYYQTLTKYYHKLSHKTFTSDFNALVNSLIAKRKSLYDQDIEYGVMESALQESMLETQEYEYITYKHYKVINRIIELESARGVKHTDISNADTESVVSYFDDDINNNILCQSIISDTNINDIDRRMLKYLHDGYTMPEIAGLLNTNISTLKSRLFSLKKSLSYMIDTDSELSVITQSKKTTTAKITDYTVDQVNNIMSMYLKHTDIKDIARDIKIPCNHVRQIISRQTKTSGHVISKYIPGVHGNKKSNTSDTTVSSDYHTGTSYDSKAHIDYNDKKNTKTLVYGTYRQ